MTSRVARAALGAVALMLSVAVAVRAQGTLSTQGLGFPPGQLSTAARLMGGAIGEVDPLSPLNPASIGLLTGAIVMMQSEPEYRQIQIDGRVQRTSVARFPLFMGALALGSRWGVGVSASTLLDRTWETTTRDSQVVSGGDMIRWTAGERSDGSIADLRLAVSYSPLPWLKLGVGGHALSGRDQARSIRAFDDTVRFATDTQRTTLSFGGNALSAGALAMFPRRAVLGVSYRRGGGISVESGNRTIASGFAPDHYGASLVYLGINGAALGVRAAKDGWARLKNVAPSLNIHEGWDVGVGADVSGPTYGAIPVALRLGGRWRTLPFSADTTPVKEQTLSGGFAFSMARNRVELNIGGLRASRTGSGTGGISETAWTISTSFSVRP